MMLTRCPRCSTAFRVTPEQLKARAGKVRCGHCNGVFNALETLEDAPPAVEPVPAPPGPDATAVEAEASPPAAPAAADLQDTVAEDAPADGASVDLLLEDIGAPAPVPLTEPAPAPASRRPALAWGAAILLALGLLGLQVVYVLRAELAVSQPEWRPLLENLCDFLACDIPLPRKTDLVSIEASDLHPDPQQKNLLVLVATLRNRAAFAQEYPHLEVTLTDTRDQPMIRRVFIPEEYLAQGTNVRAGFAANGELALNLWLDAGDTGASGYRLYLFYP